MKNAFHPVAAALLMWAGIGSGCADEGAGGQGANQPAHYTFIDAAFLSGGGFKSGPESYAAQDAAGGNDVAKREGARAELPESGAHYSRTEYLFLTGAAFHSGREGYPLSW